MHKKIVLCILDGVGYREDADGNAFLNAKTPNIDKIISKYPSSFLEASGRAVGLPEFQMGTSEVGHMNIGSGRVIVQPLEQINEAIKNDSLGNDPKLLSVFEHVKRNNSTLHITGLLSDGGVHSHIDHLLYLLKVCKKNNIENIYLHLFTDGRDTYEKSALNDLKKVSDLDIGKIATISGRYYGMDRDSNYNRVRKSYDAMCYGIGPKYDNYEELINDNYSQEIFDEFINPGIIEEKTIEDNDALITFNFRKDRLRELFTLFSNKEISKNISDINLKEFNNLKTLTMFPVVGDVKSPFIFNDLDLKNLLVDYLIEKRIPQLRIAETEKYAHVTFFFDGGKEVESEYMKKILIPSPKVATYDLMPEMSAFQVTDTLLKEVSDYDFTVLNLANGDMVGHTGNYEAAVKAVEVMDSCIGKIYSKVVEELDGILIIMSDHGNCEVMWDENKNPVTSHTLNPVRFIVTKEKIELKNGKLADVAPTILNLMDLDVPIEMTGNILIKE